MELRQIGGISAPLTFVRKSCLHVSVLLLGGLYINLEEFLGHRSRLTHLFKVETPTPKTDVTWGRVSPLVVVMRTASRLNSSP